SQLLFGSHGKYDVIVSQPSNPWIAGQAMLFTKEFFELVRGHLAPDGMFCQWLQGYGLRAGDFRSVVATFLAGFPQASWWEESPAGGDYLLIGSTEPRALDTASLARLMEQPPVRLDLQRVEVNGPGDLLAHYVAGPDRVAALARGATIQDDDHASLEFTA